MKQNTQYIYTWFAWSPKVELIFVIISWILVTGGLAVAFQVFTTEMVALNFITFGPITLLGFGLLVPLLWTLKRKRKLSDLGITSNRILLSIILSVVFALIQYSQTLAGITLPPVIDLIPLIAMALTVGLFEAIFFRGWIQLRFEEYFGVVPAIFLGALFYAFYHVGYGMPIDEIIFLFLIGIMYAVVFRLTKNILILWPFFTPAGGLYANLRDGLSLPLEATYGFVLVLVAMLISIIFAARALKSSA